MLIYSRSSLDEGIQYIETRKSVKETEPIYILDPTAKATYGKRFLDKDGEMEISLTLEVGAQQIHTSGLDMFSLIGPTTESALRMNKLFVTFYENTFVIASVFVPRECPK